MRTRLVTIFIVLGGLAVVMLFNTRAQEAAAQRPGGPSNVKRWGDPAELAEKNAGKKATLTLAIDGKVVGDVVFEFYAQDAPNTVESFIRLAEQGFYDGLMFHRVIKGFMIQGGDPDGTGTGGPGYSLPAEFNARKHVPGTVAMARSGHPDSAGSQFYICLGTPSSLDNNYTVFGQVTSGQEHVITFGDEPTGAGDRPQHALTMTTVVIGD